MNNSMISYNEIEKELELVEDDYDTPISKANIN